MARRLIWSPQAVEDIEDIARYIERDSPWYANAVVARVIECAQRIPDHPEAGRVVPELGDPMIRERFVYSYRLIYRLRPDAAEMLAVLHGGRLLHGIQDRFPSTDENPP